MWITADSGKFLKRWECQTTLPGSWETHIQAQKEQLKPDMEQQTGKFLKRWEYQTTWPASWEICVQVKKQQLELDVEQTGSELGKEYVKAVCHPAYLTYMQSTSWEMLG